MDVSVLRTTRAMGCALALTFLVLLPVGPAAAQLSRQKDHPVIGRFEGARLLLQRSYAFDEVRVMAAPVDPTKARAQRGPGFVTVEGSLQIYYYALPSDRSPTDVIRSYAQRLESIGFTTIFQCSSRDTSCLTQDLDHAAPSALAEGFINVPSAPKFNGSEVSTWFRKQGRYILLQLERPQGPLIAAIAAGEGHDGGALVIQAIEAKDFKPSVIEGLKKE